MALTSLSLFCCERCLKRYNFLRCPLAMLVLCLVCCDMPNLENCSPRTLVFSAYRITLLFSSSMGYFLWREMGIMSNLERFVLMSHLLSNLLMGSMASAVKLEIR